MTNPSLHPEIGKPVEIAPRLPDTALPRADWADAFGIITARRFENMREIAQATVGSMPRRSRCLLNIHNIVVRPFSLKTDGLNDAPDKNARIDIFPILEEDADRIVLGLDDVHLDFRIVIERHRREIDTCIRVTTLVQRHNLFGRIYIGAITPFHKVIAAAAIRQAG